MLKKDIERRGLAGQRLEASDVARTSRKLRYPVMTLRHAWPDRTTDARIWHAVRRAACDGLAALANRTGRPTELYASDGTLLEQRLPLNQTNERSRH